MCEIPLPGNGRKGAILKLDVCFWHEVGPCWTVDVEPRVLAVTGWHPGGWTRLTTMEPGQQARLESFDAVESELAVLAGDREQRIQGRSHRVVGPADLQCTRPSTTPMAWGPGRPHAERSTATERSCAPGDATRTSGQGGRYLCGFR